MIDLPDSPAPQQATPFLLDKGAILPGGLGAADLRINRKGSRFGIAVTMPPMQYAKSGRIWVSRLIDAQTEGGRMRWPLQGFDPGMPGSVLVDGSGQDGATLNVKSANAGYAFREGQFFSIVTGGTHHIYKLRSEVIADGAGDAALPIGPMLRVQHLDNDVCHFGAPMIEGFVQGDRREWDFAIANFTGLSFEIHESE